MDSHQEVVLQLWGWQGTNSSSA